MAGGLGVQGKVDKTAFRTAHVDIADVDGVPIESPEVLRRAYIVTLPVPRHEAPSAHASGKGRIVTRYERHEVHIEIDLARLAKALAGNALQNVRRESVSVNGAVRARLDRAPFCPPSRILPDAPSDL